MKITVIGSGNVGSALGQAWVRAGHEVVFGMRDEKSKPSLGGAKTARFDKAIRDAEVVVLAVPWPAVPDVLQRFDNWPSKIIIDCTNPLTAGARTGSRIQYLGGRTGSEPVKEQQGGEGVQYHRL